MTSRVARALLVARLDRSGRAVIVALVAAARPMAREDLVRAVTNFGDDRERRYRQALGRLPRDGLPAEDRPGRLVIAEPDNWIARNRIAM